MTDQPKEAHMGIDMGDGSNMAVAVMAGIVMGYYMWKAGGHYYFQINPASLGYITVAQFAKEKKVSRQYIHHRKEKWDWLNAGEKLKMVRPLPTASDALTKQG